MLSDLFLYSGVHEYCRVTIASLEQKCSVQIKKWPGPATALVSAGIKLIHLSSLYKILQNQNGNNCIVLKGSYLDCRRQGCPKDFGGPVRIPWPRSRALKPGLIRFFFHPEQCFPLTNSSRFIQIPPNERGHAYHCQRNRHAISLLFDALILPNTEPYPYVCIAWCTCWFLWGLLFFIRRRSCLKSTISGLMKNWKQKWRTWLDKETNMDEEAWMSARIAEVSLCDLTHGG